MWKASPIQAAGAERGARWFEDILPPAEKYLDELRKDKDPPSVKKEDINNDSKPSGI